MYKTSLGIFRIKNIILSFQLVAVLVVAVVAVSAIPAPFPQPISESLLQQMPLHRIARASVYFTTLQFYNIYSKLLLTSTSNHT